MMVRIMILLVLMVTKAAYANVALDELKTLLAPKTVTQTQDPEIRDLSRNYYFVFIYRCTCPHCHNFAPILHDFSETFHIRVQAYSLDNEPLDGFEASLLTPTLFQTLYVAGGFKPSVPALFLVNRYTLEAYAVLFGEASPYQLARRVHELHLHIEAKFHD